MIERHGYTVLYVEDEADIRASYTRLLRSRFFHVWTASDGFDALQVYRNNAPDIVVADIVMPRIDGMTFVKKIRKEEMRTRIILLTAYDDCHYLFDATQLDISNYLLKPVRKRAFLEALDKAVDQLRMIDGLIAPEETDRTHRRIAEIVGLPHPEEYLTKNEIIFLHLLASDPRRYFSLSEIATMFYYESDKELTPDAIKALIKRLRKKLPHIRIENRFGHGYRLRWNR